MVRLWSFNRDSSLKEPSTIDSYSETIECQFSMLLLITINHYSMFTQWLWLFICDRGSSSAERGHDSKCLSCGFRYFVFTNSHWLVLLSGRATGFMLNNCTIGDNSTISSSRLLTLWLLLVRRMRLGRQLHFRTPSSTARYWLEVML